MTQNFQDRKKSAFSSEPKTDETRDGPKKLLTNISALCPLQDPRKTYLHPRQATY